MDRHSDVFAIGGGIIGLASAYYLAKEGKGVRLAPDIKRFMWFLNFASKCNPGHMAHAIRAREKILQNSKSLFETLFREEQLECNWEIRVSCWYLKPKRKGRNMFKPMTGCEPHIDPTAFGVNRF